ncbi:hypothetical protein CYMTET_56533 [Cymbomonas tetramitiformis]|uniref:Phosphoribosyltransferase domain-containing protein n=1 Tax=Cymbomonas tetramitiformis TaxID=36881 RepID=A0AAE0ELQ9_9CHLO|nr:hypothetical protein CYMTET_56533 [Cymbomonas tetramitiformis]
MEAVISVWSELVADPMPDTQPSPAPPPDDAASISQYKSLWAAARWLRMFEVFPDTAKVKSGDKRKVTIMDGDVLGKKIVIVDDLVQSGGTLFECGKALMEQGANSVAAFVAHAVFPNDSWKRFITGGDRCIFK